MVKSHSSVAKTSIAAKSGALEQFHAAYHAVRADLHRHSLAISQKMSEIRKNARGGLTDKQNAQLDALAKEQINISNKLQEYAQIQNMALNNSAAVKALVVKVREVNNSLKKSFEKLENIVKVINNLNGFLAMLDSLLKAATGLVAVL